MNQQEMADLLEIQQLAARYMMLSARKDNDHWLEVFTPDGVYNAFGTPYGLDDFPMLLKSAPPGQYIGNAPVVEFHGDTATGVQHYVFVDQDHPRDASRLVRRRVRAHCRRLAYPPRVRPRSCAAAARSTTARRTTPRASSPAKRST